MICCAMFIAHISEIREISVKKEITRYLWSINTNTDLYYRTLIRRIARMICYAMSIACISEISEIRGQ